MGHPRALAHSVVILNHMLGRVVPILQVLRDAAL
jgi:hypothetical protein